MKYLFSRLSGASYSLVTLACLFIILVRMVAVVRRLHSAGFIGRPSVTQ